MDDSIEAVPVQKKWFKLGLAVAFLHYVFLLLVIVLLQIDLFLGVAVAVIVSLVGGIAFLIFVLYIY